MQNNLDSSQNIAEIIKSASENLKEIEKVVIDISKSIANINKKVDLKEFKKSSTSFKTIIAGVNEYVNGMYEVIDIIANPKKGIVFDDEFKKDILGIDAELSNKIAKGELKSDSKIVEERLALTKSSSIPRQILAFSSVVSELFKSFNTLGNALSNPLNILAFKYKMQLAKDNLQAMITMMIDSFTSIDTDKAKDILGILSSEPEKTKTLMENTTFSKSISNSLKEGDYSTSDSNNENEAYIQNMTETTKGRQGLIDIILGVINALQLLNNLPMPKLLIFRWKLNRSMKQIKLLYSDISKFIENEKFDVAGIDKMNKSFEKITETFIAIKQIIDNVHQYGTLKNLAKTWAASKTIKMILGTEEKEKSILTILYESFASDAFKTLTNGDTVEKLSKIKQVINTLKTIALNLSTIGILIVPLLLALVGIKTLKMVLDLIIKTFNADTLKSMETMKTTIVQLSLMIIMLSTSVLLLALTGLLVFEAMPAFGGVVVYLLFVFGMLYLTNLIITFMKEIKADKNLLYLSAIIVTLSLTVVLLALTGQLITEEWDNILQVALLFAVVVGAFILISNFSKSIEEGGKQLLYIGATLAILCVTVLLLVLISKIISDNWENLLIVTGLFVVISTVFILASLAAEKIEKGGKQLLFIAASLVSIILSVLLLAVISNYVSDNLDNIWHTLAILGGIVAAFIVIGLFSKLLEKGSKMVLVIAVALIIMSTSLLIIAKATESLDWEGFGKFCAIVGVLITITLGLGIPAVAALALIGTVVLTAISVAFLIFTVSLKHIISAIQDIVKLNLDPEKDKDIIKLPIDILYSAIKRATDINILTLGEGLLKIGMLSNVASALSNIADIIQKFAELKIPTKFDKDGKPIAFAPMTQAQFNQSAENIQKILTCILSAIGSEDITKTLDELSSDAIENIGKILENTSGVTHLIDAIEKAVLLDDSKITAGILNLKTSIIGYIKLMDDLFCGEFDEKMLAGVSLPQFLLQKVTNPIIDEDILDEVKDGTKNLLKTLKPFKETFDILSELSSKSINKENMISNLDTIKIVNETIFGDGVENKGIYIPNKSKSKDAIKHIERLTDSIKDFTDIDANNLSKNSNSFVKLIDKANSINTDKIKSIRDMFEQIARFSESIKGNFDKLADVLSEKLVDVLANINETIGNINSNKSGNNISNLSSNNAVNTNTSAQETKRNIEQMNKLVSIADSLEDILSVLKEVRENTDYQYKI